MPLQRVSVAQCDQTTLAGTDDIRDREALESSVRVTATEQDKGQGKNVYIGKRESVTPQRVSVAQCDQ